MTNQPTLADPIPGWGPAEYSYPVNNPAAPRAGWFVDDGTCHGEPTHGGHANALGSNLYASDETSGCLQSESEEDAVTPELPVGSPASPAIDEASPTLATLMNKSNIIAVVPAAADKPRVPASDKDVGHQTDSGRAAASEQGGDKNAPTTATSGLMSVADVLALWARNSPEELWREDENEEYETDSEDDEHGDEDGEEDDEEGDDVEDDEDTDEVEDDEEDVPLRVRVTSPLYRYLGYESRYH